MDKDQTPLDLELHSYVDGALDDAGMARIELHLRNNPEAAAKVRDYFRQKTEIRSFADRALTHSSTVSFDTLERQLAKRLKRRNFLFSWRGMAAAFALFTTGWIAHPTVDLLLNGPEYTDELVLAHALATTDPDEIMDMSPDRVHKLFGRIQEMEYVPDLRPLGYIPFGAQLIPSDDGMMLHIPYRHESDGTLVSYFLLHDAEEEELPTHFVHRQGVTVAYWQHDHSHYALAAPLPDMEMNRLASFLDSGTMNFQNLPQALDALPASF